MKQKNDIKFYKFVNYKHFNMLSINNAFKLIGLRKYMAAIDLTEPMQFFSIPIHPTYSLKISKIYILLLISIISCMSNGYGPAVRAFTKIS